MDAQALIDAARTQTGLNDLGDDRILEGLDVLVHAMNTEAKLTPAGDERMGGMIVKALANRLRVEEYLAQHPALLDAPVEKPMFVFGLPRTGTTLVINLLNVDPTRRCFLRWESFDAVPPPKAGELSTDPRCLAEKAKLEMASKYMPHISAMHNEEADGPSECQFSMAHSLCAQIFDSNAHIPSYRKWMFDTNNHMPAFEFQKRLFQVLQSEAPGRWTLKNPWHPLYLGALTSVYPDAQLIMTHRDPAEVVASASSLVHAVSVMFSDAVDPVEVGQRLMETFDLMIERTLAYKAANGWDSIYDVQYQDVMRDPIGVMRGIYNHFDEPFTPALETAMTDYLAANPKGKHGKHDYSLEQFGLTKKQVRDHYAAYIERFQIKMKD